MESEVAEDRLELFNRTEFAGDLGDRTIQEAAEAQTVADMAGHGFREGTKDQESLGRWEA